MSYFLDVINTVFWSIGAVASFLAIIYGFFKTAINHLIIAKFNLRTNKDFEKYKSDLSQEHERFKLTLLNNEAKSKRDNAADCKTLFDIVNRLRECLLVYFTEHAPPSPLSLESLTTIREFITDKECGQICFRSKEPEERLRELVTTLVTFSELVLEFYFASETEGYIEPPYEWKTTSDSSRNRYYEKSDKIAQLIPIIQVQFKQLVEICHSNDIWEI